MSHNTRQERERARLCRAAAAIGAAPGPALDAALAQIGAAFDESAAICHFKIRVERWLCLEPHHPAARARFGARAEMLSGRNLDDAVIVVERWWRHERKAFQIASALGRGSRLSVDVLRELRLILRWMHFNQLEAEFDEAVVVLCGHPLAMAAE